MKNKITLYFLILLLTSFFGYTQESDEKMKKQIEFAEKFAYDIGANIFYEPYMDSVSKELVSKPWERKPENSLNELKSGLDSLNANATITIDKKLNYETDKIKLRFESYFPSYIEDIEKIFKISIKESNLKTLSKEKLEVEKLPLYSFISNTSRSISVNGENTFYKWETVDSSFPIEVDSTMADQITGSVSFKVEIATTVDYIKLNKNNIGEEFILNGKKYKLINIIHNKVVIEMVDIYYPLEKGLSFFNINKDGKAIIGTSFLGRTAHSKNNTREGKKISDVSTTTVPEKVYTIFKENPEISIEEFKEKVHSSFSEFMKDPLNKMHLVKHLGSPYIIFESAGPIHDFYLYTPKFDLEKEFTIKL